MAVLLRLMTNPQPIVHCASASSQADREEATQWRNYWAVGGGTSRAGGGEGAAHRGLHLLRLAAQVHHRHPVRPGLLHLLWHPLQFGRGHCEHGQRPHRLQRQQGSAGGESNKSCHFSRCEAGLPSLFLVSQWGVSLITLVIFFHFPRQLSSHGIRKQWGWSTAPSFGATSSRRSLVALYVKNLQPTGECDFNLLSF